VGARPRVIAVLEALNDHENVGALFRNAAAFGAAGVLLDPTCADPLYRRSIRVSVGHVLHMPFARLAPWPTALDQVRAAGFVVAALAPRAPTDTGVPVVSLAELRDRMSGPGHRVGVALLLGAEGPGLTDAALAASHVVVRIPMADGVDSLNVATAAAIAFHSLADL
jgi:tRNA G18 (ribose-2'-O)-methylase SpoU